MKANIQIRIEPGKENERYRQIARALKELASELEDVGVDYQKEEDAKGEITLLFEIVDREIEALENWLPDEE